MGAEHLKSWKPGQSGNPSGKPKLPDHLRFIASLTQNEVTKIVSKYARMSAQELLGVIEDGKAPALELAIAQVFQKSIQYGDSQRLSFLLDRAVGKVKPAEESDEELAARQELQRLTTQELVQLARENILVLEAKKPE